MYRHTKIKHNGQSKVNAEVVITGGKKLLLRANLDIFSEKE